jgi:cytochrome c oxidase cbb3-type subunit 3
MADFTSDFWNWWIIILTLGGIAAMIFLILWMTEGKAPTESPETMGHVWDEDLAEYNNPLPRWWLIMFWLTIAFTFLYVVLYPGMGKFEGILGWTSTGQYEKEVEAANATYQPLYDKYMTVAVADLSKDEEAMKTAKRLFINYCTVCHGSDARGTIGFPNLTDTDWLYGGSADTIKTTILNGRSGAMPAWHAALGDDGIKDVTEYVLSLSGRRVDTEAAARGKEKYSMCIACHGADGKGNQALGAPNLTDNIWLYGGSKKAVMDTLTNGRNGNMPAFKEFLGEAKVHLLAAYVYGLSEKQ